VDINWIMGRIRGVLLTPQTEWPLIAAEADTVQTLYKRYILFVAAVPAIAYFLKMSVFGSGVFGVVVRWGLTASITAAVLQYAVSLLMVFIMALIVDALAASFASQKSQVQALKAVAYAWTAAWAGACLIIIPWIGWLFAWFGMGYAIYLLYWGLRTTLQTPADKAIVFTVVIALCGLVISTVLGSIVAMATMGQAFTGGAQVHLNLPGGKEVTVDSENAINKLRKLGDKLEKAGKKIERAQQSGDSQAQVDAAAKMVGTLLSGGDEVQAIALDQLKPLLPDRFANLARQSVQSSKGSPFGFELSQVKAKYGDENGRKIVLEISDAGSAKGVLGLASWMGIESETEDAHGYEKTYKTDGQLRHEKWSEQSRSSEYTVVVADRFVVKTNGENIDMDELKSAFNELDLDALAALKEIGVKHE
jgi:hypothetical protein